MPEQVRRDDRGDVELLGQRLEVEPIPCEAMQHDQRGFVCTFRFVPALNAKPTGAKAYKDSLVIHGTPEL